MMTAGANIYRLSLRTTCFESRPVPCWSSGNRVREGSRLDNEAASTQVANAMARLEAALERIARVATAGIIRAGRSDAAAETMGLPPEAVERLDKLIARLRAELSEPDAL